MSVDARFTASADPAIREDGTCPVCGRARRFDGVKPLYRKAAESDPFCSSPCARRFHGCSLPEGQRGRVTRGA